MLVEVAVAVVAMVPRGREAMALVVLEAILAVGLAELVILEMGLMDQ